MKRIVPKIKWTQREPRANCDVLVAESHGYDYGKAGPGPEQKGIILGAGQEFAIFLGYRITVAKIVFVEHDILLSATGVDTRPRPREVRWFAYLQPKRCDDTPPKVIEAGMPEFRPAQLTKELAQLDGVMCVAEGVVDTLRRRGQKRYDALKRPSKD